MSAPLPRLFPISSTWDQTVIEEEERWDPGNILTCSKLSRAAQLIKGDSKIPRTVESSVWHFSSLSFWIWARQKKFKIQDKGFVLTPYPLYYSNYYDAPNEMSTFNKWFTDCKKEYRHKVILGRYLSKWILILMSFLVLEGNMILISGVSGASPTSLLSVNFLFGSWPDKEVTLSS